MARRRHPVLRAARVLVTLGLLFLLLFALTRGRSGRVGALSGLFGGDAIGVVEIEGTITDSKDTIEELKRYEKARFVKAIILRIESPGGGVAASQEIYEEIGKLKKKKPVIASLGGVAASGGYYIASACDMIVANAGTITGSIGVIVQLGNVQELLEKLGLQGYTIKSGPYKDMGSPLKKLTPESRQVFQGVVDNIHMQFVRAVAAGRKMDLQQVERLADGRIYSGEQAKAVGLVDRLGNLEDAVHIAAERTGIQGEPRIVTSRPGMKAWWKRLFLEKASQLARELFFSIL